MKRANSTETQKARVSKITRFEFCQCLTNCSSKECVNLKELCQSSAHRCLFCQFLFQWIYYCYSSKSTRKKTGKTHLCAMQYLEEVPKMQDSPSSLNKRTLLRFQKYLRFDFHSLCICMIFFLPFYPLEEWNARLILMVVVAEVVVVGL